MLLFECLSSLNYIQVSGLYFPYLFAQLPCAISLCLFSSLYIVFYIVFCYILLPAKYLYSILLQLPLEKYILQLFLVFTSSSCTGLLLYIPNLWVHFVLAFLEALSVYLQPVSSFVLRVLNYVHVIP